MLSFREYAKAFRAWRQVEQARSRELWEIARLEATLIINPTLKKQIKDPKKLIRFEWERAATPKMQTVEEQKLMVLAIAEAFKPRSKKKKVPYLPPPKRERE